jgi:PucR family transcriptional regulator, purine catabolism regulatory protein
MSASAPTAAALDALPGAPLGDLHERMVEAVVAGGGLGAVARLAAAAAGGPVAVVAPAEGIAAIAPHAADPRLAAVRRYVADRLVDRPARVPAALAAEAPIRAGARSLGAVVALADGGDPAPKTGEIVRLAALVALTALTLERDEHRAGSGGALVRALRERPSADAALLLAQADAGASALAHGAVALCAQHADRACWVVPTIAEQFPGALSLEEDGMVWALLPARPTDDAGRATTAAAHRVVARLSASTAVGVSPFVAGPERLHAALRQARLVLELARGGEVDVGQATTGTWRMLLAMAVSDPDELATCVATSIGPAVEHDARLRTELVATFRAYLDHGANMNATAAAIYAHRHTVAARLERLRALTRLDPTRHDDRERLGVGLKARAVLTASREVR